MKNKRWLILLLVFVFILSACGESANNDGLSGSANSHSEQNENDGNRSDDHSVDDAGRGDQAGNDGSDRGEASSEAPAPLKEDEYEIVLADRLPVFGQDIGVEEENGAITYAGGTINKSLFPMPGEVAAGDKVTVTLTGQFHSARDTSARVYLSNDAADNISKVAFSYPNSGTDIFSVTFELEALEKSTHLMLASSAYNTFFDHFTLHRLTVSGDIDTGYLEDENWYQTMLERAQMNIGNNYRLKAVIEKAQAGEEITFAAIGGSITESGGAAKYTDGYAYQIYEKFKQEYGAGDGSKVKFVNAGVGGTPSTFGIMRYERDIVAKTTDPDGLPDIVIVEYAVNDGGEPTNHGAYESLVKNILMQPNDPVVILLFSVFPGGFTLQNELKKIGETYDLMMVSIKDGPYAYVGKGKKWTEEEFYSDQYHPSSLGHGVMADALFHTIREAYEMPTAAQDIDLDVPPAYSTAYVGLRTIFKDDYDEGINLSLGSFSEDDPNAYTSLAVGKVYANNFHHVSGTESLTFTIHSKNMLLAYRAVSDPNFGEIDVYVDGKKVRTINGNTGGWGQSETVLIFAEDTAAEHHIEIKMAPGSENKKFTITCIGYTP